MPEWLRPLLHELENSDGRRWRDQDLRTLGLDPKRVSRWFKQHHNMTFHAYHRAPTGRPTASGVPRTAALTQARLRERLRRVDGW